MLHDSNLQELCTSTLLYPSHRPLGLPDYLLHLQLPGHVLPYARLRDYIHGVPVTRATCLQVMYTLSTRGHVPPWPWGHMTSPLTPPTHTGTCALEHASPLPRSQAHPGLQSQGHMPPPPQHLLSVSRHKVKCPSTPHLCSPTPHQCGPALVKGISPADTCMLICAPWLRGHLKGKRAYISPCS